MCLSKPRSRGMLLNPQVLQRGPALVWQLPGCTPHHSPLGPLGFSSRRRQSHKRGHSLASILKTLVPSAGPECFFCC